MGQFGGTGSDLIGDLSHPPSASLSCPTVASVTAPAWHLDALQYRWGKFDDGVTARIPCGHASSVTGGRICAISPHGEVEWSVDKRMPIPGSHESTLSTRSREGSDLLEIDGNPAKWLQGHNLFGSDNLVGLLNEVMIRLEQVLGLSPSPADRVAWETGNYLLTRVACTGM